MKFRPEVKPFLLASFVFGVFICTIAKVSGASNGLAFFLGLLFGGAGTGYMLFFFRDPEIVTPTEPGIVVAAANGKLAKITEMYEKDYLKQDTIRISIFLSLFDVHVNRFPIGGFSTFLGYFPGKRLFTFDEKSSDVNQHNAILVRNEETSCLVRQIVGPVCRRVVLLAQGGQDNNRQAGRPLRHDEVRLAPRHVLPEGRHPDGREDRRPSHRGRNNHCPDSEERKVNNDRTADA